MTVLTNKTLTKNQTKRKHEECLATYRQLT